MVRRLPSAVAALTGMVVMLGVVGCTGGDPKPKPSPSAEGSGPVVRETAPDGGQLRVVDSGYTAVMEYPTLATFGAVIENTSKTRTAVSVQVTATFFDASGRKIPLLGIE